LTLVEHRREEYTILRSLQLHNFEDNVVESILKCNIIVFPKCFHEVIMGLFSIRNNCTKKIIFWGTFRVLHETLEVAKNLIK